MTSSLLRKNIVKVSRFIQRPLSFSVIRLTDDIIEPPDTYELAVLNYEKRRNDPVETKRARLLYQSRKRGMLENDLLLSTFAAKYLPEMNATQIDEYDKIINLPSNDWDLFNWVMGAKPTPPEFENDVMQILKEHVKNVKREPRLSQPPL